MAIPKHDEIIPFALDYLAKEGVHKSRDLEAPLGKIMQLTDEEVAEVYASGNGAVFMDRISWALSYLLIAKLIERPKRSFYQVTNAAMPFVGKADEVKGFVKEAVAKRDAIRRAEKVKEGTSVVEVEDSSNITPHEALDSAYANIRSTTYEAILDTILSKTPYEFESLVVKLLDKMGYGGQVKDAGQVTQASNDGGIDGIIKEDVLGLGRIHIQAKRYARSNAIGRDEIQKFVGALAVAQSNKGVFISTSRYTQGAKDYAQNLNGNTNLVLIDGLQLAEYIYDFSLGMQTKQVVEIKELDADFWDAMKDEPVAE